MPRENMLNVSWLKQNKIRGVVQAGMGSIVDEIIAWNAADIKNQIYIEPHPGHFKNLSIDAPRLACVDAKVLCIEAALTNIVGKIKLYLNTQDASHSTLPMYEGRPEVVKWMVTTGEIEVEATTLDNIFETSKLNPEDYNFLVLDTQCSEHLIIEGAKTTLKYFDFIEIEIAMTKVYADSLIYDEWIPMMDKLGYQVISEHLYYQLNTDLGSDVTFCKKSLVPEGHIVERWRSSV